MPWSSGRNALLAFSAAVLAVMLGMLARRKRKTRLQTWTGWGTSPYAVLPHVSAESKQRAVRAILQPTDVVILTFPKTGTTMLQQVCEQLRTGGDMNFSEITERQPWLEFAWDCGQDLNADQIATPRMFKSHQLLSAINPGAKYVSIIRDPAAVLLSWFHFQKGKGRPVFIDCKDANEYASKGHFEGQNIFGTNVWDYYVELWQARQQPNVLVLCYESVLKNMQAHLPEIASFLGVACDDKVFDAALHMASKEFMAAHDNQFDDHFIADMGKKFGRCNRVLEIGVKVTAGHKNDLTPETQAWLKQKWTEKVTPSTGFVSYDEMSKAILLGL